MWGWRAERWELGSLWYPGALILALDCQTLDLFSPLLFTLLSCVGFTAAQWTAAHQAFLSSAISRSLLKFMSIESVMLSNHFILFQPFLLLPSVFLSIKVFSSALALCIWWSKYWNFGFSNSPSNEYSGLISFKIAWFDLLADFHHRKK